jgi:uncharacterized membrane protein YhfC
VVTVGADGLLNIIFIFLFQIALPIWITLFVKKKMPNKLPAGIALSFFFPFVAHLYLDGALIYILILIVITVTIGYASIGLSIWPTINILSALLIFYRFKKLKNAETKDTTTIDIKVEDD